MTELIISALWVSALVYAVWSIRQAATTFLTQRKPSVDKDIAAFEAELLKLRFDLNKTTRVASSAALAVGLREDGK